MEKLNLPQLSEDERAEETDETDETVSEFPFTDDGILITARGSTLLVMGGTLTSKIRRALSAWLKDVFVQGSSIRIDLPRPNGADSGEIKLPPGSQKISAFVSGNTISLPN